MLRSSIPSAVPITARSACLSYHVSIAGQKGCFRNPALWREKLQIRRYGISATASQPYKGNELDAKIEQEADSQSTRPSAAPDKGHQTTQSTLKHDELSQNSSAMTRRLEAMAEDSLEASPMNAATTLEAGGFSEELKAKLQGRLQDRRFRSQHPEVMTTLTMPDAAGQGTRNIAQAQPWTGFESTADAALRMLDDAHKPLRGVSSAGRRRPPPSRSSTTAAPARHLEVRPPKVTVPRNPAQRLARARDQSTMYALTQDLQDTMLSDKERAEMRRDLQERLQPGARSMPASITGLQSLASQRIEDAIARGQFANIPRGKGVNTESDPAAMSPFLDTTEYLMNRLIKRQDVLPPWVERQNELTRAAHTFRARLRNDWKRHAARMIARDGGSLAEQMQRAERYARAEQRVNPQKKPSSEPVKVINLQGVLTAVDIHAEDDLMGQSAPSVAADAIAVESSTPTPSSPADASVPTDTSTSNSVDQSDDHPPFRDPTWEATELSYHRVALENLNSLTRSYNLLAPDLAKKPYWDLNRELRACFAAVAPLVAAEIEARAVASVQQRDRANRRTAGVAQGVLDALAARDRVAVRESPRPQYGLKEWWRDLTGRA